MSFKSLRSSLFLVFSLLSPGLQAQSFQPPEVFLSPQAEISVLTMGPGKEVYLAFGHSALRVTDPVQGLDLVFNYGTFSVEDPLFIPLFIRGELNYRLEVYPSTGYYLEYDKKYQNRIWIQQDLNLTAEQKQSLYRFLVRNARPENRFYIYDFLRDNCSTRITDALSHVLGTDLKLKSSLESPRSFRSLLDEYAVKRPFWQFLFALAVGSSSDLPMAPLEEDWMPFYLLYILDRSEVVQGEEVLPLVKRKHILHEPNPPSDYSAPWSDPGFLLWPLAILVILGTLWSFRSRSDRRPKVWARRADLVLFLFTSLAGTILFYLDFFSIHTAAQGNWNLVWVNPLALGGVWALVGGKFSRGKRWLFFPSALGAGIVILLWPWWPQTMPLSFLPFQGLLLARSLRRFLEEPALPKK